LIKAKINGVSGNFILDTGASNSCVDLKALSYSAAEASKTKASGAGATGMFTQTASNNKLQLEFGKIHHSI
jgi:predicted aspartyl protease